ncbi:MAG: signal peptidase I [Acholeplasmataceae bacterium]
MSEKIQSKPWDIVKTVIFFVVAGILLSYILIEAFLPTQTVHVFGFKPYVVITRSMEPEIRVNDIVVVKQFDAEDLEVDDIITFMADINYDGTKEVVTHYIHSITENSQGDLIFRTRRYYEDPADYVPDTWFLAESDILGEYMFQIPRLGVLVLFLQSPFGIAALVVNVGVIIAVVKIIKTPKKEETVEVEQEEKDSL